MLNLKAVTFLASAGMLVAAEVYVVALALVMKGSACVPVAKKQT